MAERELKVVISAVDNLTGPFNSAMTNARHSAERTSSGISSSWLAVTAAAATAAVTINKAWDLAVVAAKFDEQKTALQGLTKQYGISAEQMLSSIESASAGTVSRLDAITVANKSFLMGLDPAKVEFFTGAAKRLADTLGGDTVQAFDALTRATQTGTVRQLRSFGVIVDLEAAYKKYGNTLTQAEKQAINFEVIQKELGEKMRRMGPDTDTAADAAERYTASMKNFSLAVGEFLTPALSTAAGILSTMLDGFTEIIKFVDRPPMLLAEKIAFATGQLHTFNNEIAVLEYRNKHFGESLGIVYQDLQGFAADTREELSALQDELMLKRLGAGKIKIQAGVEIETFARGMSVGEIQRGLAAAMHPLMEQAALKAPRLDMPITLNWTLLSDARDMEAEMDSLAQKREIDKEEQLRLLTVLMVEENALNTERIKSYVLNSDIVLAAQQSMSDQMLALVETGKFSAEEFGKVIIAQVKMTLVGIAAEAAIRAAYATALGFYYAAIPGMQGYSAAAFTAAAEMAATAGISLASAAGVQALFGGQTTRPAAGSIGGEPVRTSVRTSPAVPMAATTTAAGGETLPTQNITVIIQNGMGDAEYWKKLTEDNIIPAINDAADRNVNLVVKYA